MILSYYLLLICIFPWLFFYLSRFTFCLWLTISFISITLTLIGTVLVL